ncbi:hypothetical protein [Latilactobacillus sakei]|uniref:hypothetical protein n=1 Tax=Latilactobacillus sakei TaxID=1599 RepID=UPI003F53A331
MSKLTLDEKHRKLADCINSLKSNYLLSEVLLVAGRKLNNLHPETEALIAKIYLADGIDWITTKYNWRFKSKKIYARYISSRYAEITFFKRPFADNIMTESEFKKLLEGTGLPFEAFEKVNADD